MNRPTSSTEAHAGEAAEHIRYDTSGLMDGAAYKESLRRYKPRVYVDGRLVESVVDEPMLRPGVNALAVSNDFAHDADKAPLMLAQQTGREQAVNRMLYVNESAGDLLSKLEAVRVLCQETGCAQRYLTHDALNGIAQAAARMDDVHGGNERSEERRVGEERR